MQTVKSGQCRRVPGPEVRRPVKLNKENSWRSAEAGAGLSEEVPTYVLNDG